MSIASSLRSTGKRIPRRTKLSEPAEHGPSSSDLAAHAITDRVLSGRWVPGQRLIEGDLSRDLKVGRGTIREALKRLAAERVIALIPHRGAFVRALTREEALELEDVIVALYGLAASLAAARIEHGDNRRRLTAAYQRLAADGPQSDRILHAVDRSSLYDVMFSICGNRELMRINPAVLVQILRMQIHPFLTVDDLNEAFTDYRPLYEALIRGDGPKARRAFEQHMRCRRKQLERLPDDAFASELHPSGGAHESRDRF
jgi:DNA-binding GntR family transcriptional regulator